MGRPGKKLNRNPQPQIGQHFQPPQNTQIVSNWNPQRAQQGQPVQAQPPIQEPYYPPNYNPNPVPQPPPAQYGFPQLAEEQPEPLSDEYDDLLNILLYNDPKSCKNYWPAHHKLQSMRDKINAAHFDLQMERMQNLIMAVTKLTEVIQSLIKAREEE